MHTKLTLRLDDDLIKRAKEHAERTGRSLSQMVADYFALLGEDPAIEELPPVVRSLKGLMTASNLDEADYHDYIEQKHPRS